MKIRIAIHLLILFAAVALPVVAQEGNKDIPVTTSSKEALQLFQQGLHYLDIGRALESRETLSKAIEKDPTFAHAYFYRSLAALSPEEFKKDLDAGLKNLSGKSEGEKLLLQIADTFIDNDTAKRLELSKNLTTMYPQGARAWMRVGFAEANLNHHEVARQAFSKAVEFAPKMVGAHYALGFSYLFNEPKNFDLAAKHFEHSIQLEPNEAKAYENLGDVYRAKNELEKARESYTSALSKDPKLSVASLKKGHINSFLGHYDEARSDYDKGINGAEIENKINFANFKAFTYLHAGDTKGALQELEQLNKSTDSYKLPKDQSDAIKLGTLTNQVTIALHHNLFDDARKILDQIRKLTDESIARVADKDFTRQQNANLLLFEGQLAARKKDYAGAKARAEENRKLMEADTNPRKFEGYYGLLGLIELLQGNHAKAVENYKKADLTNIYMEYQLALAQEAAGNKADARAIFSKVAKWNFNTVTFALVRKDAMQRS